MGNHAAGKSIGLAAELVLSRRQPGDTALGLLDAVCKGYSGCDAVFEAEDPNRPGYVNPEFRDYRYPHPKAALGMLMLEAFAPNGVADLAKYAPMLAPHPEGDKAYELWWDEVCQQFRKRYDFW